MNQIKCDNCNNTFVLIDELIQTKIIDNITVKYFECDACNEKYIVSCLNAYILNKQLKYQSIVKEKAKLIQEVVNNKYLHITKYDKKIKAIDAKKLRVLEDMKRHSDMIASNVKDRL